MIERTYRCNLCHDAHKPDELVGILWSETGKKTTLGAAVKGWVPKPARETEHHLCLSCLDDIRSFPEREPSP